MPKRGPIQTEEILDGAITTSKIADSAVTTEKISASAVTTSRIADGAVTNAKIADGAVTNTKVSAGTLTYDRLGANEIYIRAMAGQIEAKSGLYADSTGVKARSPVFKFSAKHVKQLIMRSNITSIPSDATVRVGVYNISTSAYVFYRDYEGATGENEDTYTGTMPSDGDLLEVRVEVTVASATSGATFDLAYASLMIDYGIS